MPHSVCTRTRGPESWRHRSGPAPRRRCERVDGFVRSTVQVSGALVFVAISVSPERVARYGEPPSSTNRLRAVTRATRRESLMRPS